MSQITLPEYEQKNFVNRHDEIDDIRDRLSNLLAGTPPPKRTVTFKGARGVGKSWLLARLREEAKPYEDKGQALVFWLDLKRYDDRDPVLAVVDALEKFADTLPNTPKVLGATPAEISRRVMEAARRILLEKPLVIFVDHVYESDWKLLAGLEDYLLGPLAIEPHTLIILFGRGREYPWKTPELRLRAEFFNLAPLSQEETKEQLEKQISPKAAQQTEAIYETSKGNPLANYLLGSQKDPKKALNGVIEAILEVVSEDERQAIRDYLEALCVLRAFDEERIPAMMAAYYDDKTYQTWSYAQSRKVREALVKYAYTRWDDKTGGFVIDDLVRNIFEQYLMWEKPPKRWKRLQQAAEQIYLDWQNKYKVDYWKNDIVYHQEALHQFPETENNPGLILAGS